ncbi:MAG: phosphoglucomutase/phosphomannomutase family protein [Deltaproteobacteria bacterium]|nr:phosphoglucomutase/phosphomannomutase family protein [Deltaproteobacteria bacterium]
MARIRFGTSGWRGVIAEDVTVANVRVVTRAIAEHVQQTVPEGRGVVVGHDTRFLGERFARVAAEVLAGAGVSVQVITEPVPTPTLAFAVLNQRARGGVNITASHNPPEWSGLKFSAAWGGPALPEETRAIEARANGLDPGACAVLEEADARRRGLWEDLDPKASYLEGVLAKARPDLIQQARLQVAADPFYGATRGYLDEALRRCGARVTVIRNWRDPYFGGSAPDPSEANLGELRALVAGQPELALGLATDGDGDRFGILDRDGSYIEANQVLALLLDYLVRSRGLQGGVARSVATTHLIDAVARRHGLKVYETPVGFKYLGEQIARGQVVMAGEESCGFSMQGHVPEKDGVLACLLVAEMVAAEGQSLRALLARLYDEVGVRVTRRVDVPLPARDRERLQQRLQAPPQAFAGLPVQEVTELDGRKFLLEGGAWLLVRPSGTEPVVRLYVEGRSPAELDRLVQAGQEWIGAAAQR